MQNVSNKIVEKIKTHILGSINFFQKPWCVWDNVKKYYTARQATDDSTIRSRKGVIWMMDDQGKNTDTTNNVEYLLLFHSNYGYTNIPHCYITRILPFL
jgi:hypothetical protein